MTCKDCIHFIENKQIWKDIQDIGYCYASRAGEKIVVNTDCPVNRWCDNKFKPKRIMMTCKDCKYYYPTTDIEGKCKSDTDRYYGFDTTVDGTTERDCPSFIPKEDSWESVSK